MSTRKELIKLLIGQVFEVAKTQSSEWSETALAKYVANEIEENFNEQISYKTLIRIYKSYEDDNTKNSYKPFTHTLNVLSRFIGYKSFADFSSKNIYLIKPKTEKRIETEHRKEWLNQRHLKKFVIPFIVLLSLSPLVFNGKRILSSSKSFIQQTNSTEKQCMFWKNDHFELIDCNTTLSENPFAIIARNDYLLENFKEITQHDTLSEYCIQRYWYNKENGRLYIFTVEGKNPESGKELHPISERIYLRYIK